METVNILKQRVKNYYEQFQVSIVDLEMFNRSLLLN